MTTTHVIGIGSPHQADQLGWQVLELMRTQLDLHQNSDHHFICYSVEKPIDLLSRLTKTDALVLLDAANFTEARPAYRQLHYPTDFKSNDKRQANTSSHGFDIVSCLQLAGTLQLLPVTVQVYALNPRHHAASLAQALTERLTRP